MPILPFCLEGLMPYSFVLFYFLSEVIIFLILKPSQIDWKEEQSGLLNPPYLYQLNGDLLPADRNSAMPLMPFPPTGRAP